ncbi:MAG TPA: ZIP family metal transporter [Polyangia bacterium]|nr:ZIP family metal transporter [Polyangia bacterium]
MSAWINALGGVTLVSLLSLLGIFTLSWRPERVVRLAVYLVSVAAGALIGDAFLHLIPETYERMGIRWSASLLVIAGIVVFFFVEQVFRLRHLGRRAPFQPVVLLTLVGDSVHNLIDGIVIGASFSVDSRVGIATLVAVVLHEIPHELGNFGILVNGGLTVRRALLFNFLTALLAIVGTVAALAAGSRERTISVHMLPLTAGGFIYIAIADLLPQLFQEKRGWTALLHLALMVAGIALMVAFALARS